MNAPLRHRCAPAIHPVVDPRVGLFIAGVQKCGTSTLFHHLAQHPGLAAPTTKEPHVFDNETLAWPDAAPAPLHALYPPADPHRLRFEATPISLFWPPALARIHAYNPTARLIMLVRDPVERAWSHWCMEYARGWEPLPFAQAIREGRQRLPADHPTADAWRIHSYIERGRYAAQLARAQSLFGADRILVLTLDDLARDPAATLARIATFAGIAPFARPAPLRLNPRPTHAWPALPTAADRALIASELAEDSAAFTAMTAIRWPIRAPAPARSP